ncbi:hypothetical protein cypCar_00031292 [Cyprinus carpio]|nr:hypothetical protein cypCar_00031292 [Cyprinus carpio]
MAQQEYKILNDKMFTYKGTLENNYVLTPEYIDSLEDFETKDDNVFVVTSPNLVIYVMRIPKDVMVSYFHFSNNMKHLDSSERFNWMLEKKFTRCRPQIRRCENL